MKPRSWSRRWLIPGARIIFGAYYDKNLKPNQVKITLIASGFNGSGGTANHAFGSTSGRFGERSFTFSSGSPASEVPSIKKTFVSPVGETKGSPYLALRRGISRIKKIRRLTLGGGSSKMSAVADDKRKDGKEDWGK